jgi:hypothetical protein
VLLDPVLLDSTYACVRYDPRVLERVQRDEDFAAAAARASGGRPTYCDNRYYRAVANGGQGMRHWMFCLYAKICEVKLLLLIHFLV